jgi:mRNA interferase MazF
MAKVPIPKRGEIGLINFDPAIGAEIRKNRPAVVLNLDEIGRLPLRIVVPVTDWKPHYVNYPWFAKLVPNTSNGLSKDSGADAFQIKSLACDRFVRLLGRLSDLEMESIAQAIALCVGAP